STMRTMSTRVSDYMDAIEHLPEGGILIFHDVSWNDYDQLVEDLAERHFRVSYDCGRLEIVSPARPHGIYASMIEYLVRILSEELDFDLQGYGNATWRKKA